jgi:ribosomal protein S18 acetylase RimI-like enzyme
MTQPAHPILIEALDAAAARDAVPALAAILHDAVSGGASVSFMAETTHAEMTGFWQGVAADVAAGTTTLLVARQAARIVGTVQVQFVGKPNQPHRAEIAKMLVHSKARRRGIGERLMRAAEDVARQAGRTLLCLDTDDAGAARRLYGRLGWVEIGTIPGFALYPDGRTGGATFFYKQIG